MFFDHGTQLLFVFVGDDILQFDHFQVAAIPAEITILIQDVCNTAAHASCKIAPGGSQNNSPSAGHIFTTMVTDAFYHSLNAAVANTEPFSGDAANIGFTTGGAVKSDIADNDIFLRFKAAADRRADG